jgi:hypothetical protein
VSSVGSSGGRFRGTRGVLAIGILASVFGCSERFLPVLDLRNSRLVTPHGPVPFEMADDAMHPGFDLNPRLKVRARGIDLEVLVGLFPGIERVFISSMPRSLTIDVVNGGSWYRLNDTQEIPVTLTKAIRPGADPALSVRLTFDLPAPLSDYDISVYGGTMTPSRVEMIRAAEDDVHHLYLSFTADGEVYAVDLAFSVGVVSYKVMGAPGVP